jgi:hypothetical protein
LSAKSGGRNALSPQHQQAHRRSCQAGSNNSGERAKINIGQIRTRGMKESVVRAT